MLIGQLANQTAHWSACESYCVWQPANQTAYDNAGIQKRTPDERPFFQIITKSQQIQFVRNMILFMINVVWKSQQSCHAWCIKELSRVMHLRSDEWKCARSRTRWGRMVRGERSRALIHSATAPQTRTSLKEGYKQNGKITWENTHAFCLLVSSARQGFEHEV